jgi:hypothetical protein
MKYAAIAAATAVLAVLVAWSHPVPAQSSAADQDHRTCLTVRVRPDTPEYRECRDILAQTRDNDELTRMLGFERWRDFKSRDHTLDPSYVPDWSMYGTPVQQF